MSFSGDVKEELAKKIPSARHCQMAELAALFQFCGQVGRDREGTLTIGFATEKASVVKKGFTLLSKTYNISTEFGIEEKELSEFLEKIGDSEKGVDPLLVKNTCCQRSFLRGAFLGAGSVNDPTKGYHLEYVCSTLRQAEQLILILREFEIEAKCVLRKKNHVVYLKEGESISLLLNVMEAPLSLMELENTRIYKEVCNDVNRRVNCEMSNIRKIVNAASRQREDICYIRDHYGLTELPDALRQMAEVRLEYPEIPLKDLGEYLDPPVGKSGVNHRLRKLSEFADKLREERGE